MLTSEQVLVILKECLQTTTPISLTRYGDGEAIILNGFKDIRSLQFVFKRQLGYSPTIEHAEEIRNNLIKAYQECDIIGIPLPRHMNNGGYWEKAIDIIEANTHHLILEEKKVTTIDIAAEYLTTDSFKELLTGVEAINYISCRNIDEELKETFKVKRVNSFIIAPEMKFSSGYRGDHHYPKQFNSIKKWMERAIPCKGNPCLVGAGVIGKIYCNWFRDLGGIAIDVGSVMDSWAGLTTRGKDRGINIINTTYKL